MGTAGSNANLPTREFVGLTVEVLASSAIVLVILAGLWPPEYVYWTALSDAVGETTTLVVVGTVAVGLGAWLGRTSGFDISTLVVGCAIAFGVGMGVMEVLLAPDSPAHLVWYGALTGCIVAGAVAWWGLERYHANA